MNIMRQNSMLAIVTLGMTVVIRGIDLSVGALVALGGVVAAMLAGQGAVAIVGGIASATLLGVVRSSRVLQATLLRYSPRVLRLAGWHHREEVDCGGIIGITTLFGLAGHWCPQTHFYGTWQPRESLLGLGLFASRSEEHQQTSRAYGWLAAHDKRAVRACRCRSRGCREGRVGLAAARLGDGCQLAAWEERFSRGAGACFQLGCPFWGMMYNLLNLEGPLPHGGSSCSAAASCFWS